MVDRDPSRTLRGLVARSDHAGLVSALDERPWPDHVLQLVVECEGSHHAYGDMEWFIDDLEEAGNTVLADGLRRAIEGRGAFRRFKDALYPHSEQMSAFQAFSDERHRGRARSWLADAGSAPS